MSWLIFGDPPQESPRIPGVAAALGVLALEVRGKLSFALPEPWLVFPDEAPARAKVGELLAAGASAVAVPAAELARIPHASPVVDFTLGDGAFTWNGGELPWSAIRSAVLYCDEPDLDPRAKDKAADIEREQEKASRIARSARGLGGMMGNAVANSLGGPREHVPRGEPKEILELYGQGASGPVRGRIVKGVVSYRGMGPLLKPGTGQNWLTLVDFFAKKGVAVDRRGFKTKVRKALVGGIGLARIFEGSPELRDAFAEPAETLGRFVAWQKS